MTVLQFIIYFLIVFAATTLGAMTGMGGGVIIKPLLDMLGHYDAATIGLLSSATVLVMSVVSVCKQLGQRKAIRVKAALSLGAGAVVGGNLGQAAFAVLASWSGANRAVVAVQNLCLALLVILVFFYMQGKGQLPSHHFHGILAFFLAGAALGVISSFLGIGGGPINVALLIYCFSFDTKMAAVYSIVVILFAQLSKLLLVLAGEGISSYDLSMLPIMLLAAICGGSLGAGLLKQLSQKQVEKAFLVVQVFILILCIYNMAQYVLLS